MKTKNLVVLGIILITIVGIIFLSENLGSKKGGGKSTKFFPGLTQNTCSSFRISDKKGSVTIQQKNGRWIIGSTDKEEAQEKQALKEEAGTSIIEKTEEKELKEATGTNPLDDYPADSASIATVFEKLSIMSKDELISQNPEKQALFEVDSVKGTLVEVWDNQNKLLGSFRIGKNGPDWSSHFVRPTESDDVYSVAGSIKYSFFTEENRWRDKTVIKFDKTLAKKISIAAKDTATAEVSTVVLEKSFDSVGVATWNIIEPEKHEADSASVDKIVNDLSKLTTSKWEEDYELSDSAMGFDNPDLSVQVELENSDKKNLVVGKKKEDNNEKWVRTPGNKAVFIIYESKFNNMTKSLDELKKKEEEKKEEAQTSE